MDITTTEFFTLGTAVVSALITLGSVVNTVLSAHRNDQTTKLLEFERTFSHMKEKIELETQLRTQAEKDLATCRAQAESYQTDAIEDKHRWEFEREHLLDQLLEAKKNEDPPNESLPKPV